MIMVSVSPTTLRIFIRNNVKRDSEAADYRSSPNQAAPLFPDCDYSLPENKRGSFYVKKLYFQYTL